MISRQRASYLSLLAALGAVWLVLGIHALSPEPVRIGNRPLARLDLGQIAPFQPRTTRQAARIRYQQAPPHVRATKSPPSRPRQERILLFGDSMVPVLAPRLADYCLASGHELTAAVWYGSTIIFWGWHQKLDQLLAETDPTMVIAVLGSSELRVRQVSECESYVEAILRKVGNRRFVWVGPPNWREDTGVNAMLERVLGPDRYYPLGDLALARVRDGIHPSREAGIRWTDGLVRWLAAESRYQMTFAPPTRRAGPVPMRSFPPPPPYRPPP